ncbi:biopolymer transporter ExbD [candidate division KSB1 bacterium]|nr:biopolymer transporter ExbD [candidate division KSB1 bacterium]
MYFQFDEENVTNYAPRRRNAYKQFSLKLTSLIDMFTILLVFLLKSFSAEGDIMTVTKDLLLPISTSQKTPEVASIVAITDDWIMLDGERTSTTRTVLNNRRSMVIDSLKMVLKLKRDLASHIGEINTDMGFSGKICIQADKGIPYELIKKVMLTCGQTGYNDMLLAVLMEE